jgi:hypothetical protein
MFTWMCFIKRSLLNYRSRLNVCSSFLTNFNKKLKKIQINKRKLQVFITYLFGQLLYLFRLSAGGKSSDLCFKAKGVILII